MDGTINHNYFTVNATIIAHLCYSFECFLWVLLKILIYICCKHPFLSLLLSLSTSTY